MNILVVEDDVQELKEILPVCSKDDSVQTARTCQEAMAILHSAWPEVIISDAIFPAQITEYPERYKAFMIGVLLDKLRERASQSPRLRKKLPKVILISGATEAAEKFSDIAAWLSEGRLYDVVPKAGFGSWAFFRAVLAHRLDGLRRDVRFAEVLTNATESFKEMAGCGIITQHPSMLHMWSDIKRHASPESHTENLFLSGEAGVGKELVAAAVAKLKNTTLLSANCNMPEDVFLGSIVGVKPGIYTGAIDKPGLVETAGDGVLFLDQFCSISEDSQYELMRLLEEGTRDFRRVGETEGLRRAKCKFVIADTVSPKTALSAGKGDPKRLIREMYTRVAFGSVTVPPLRVRRDDIPLLARFFLDKYNPSHNKVTLDDEVIERFAQGSWPGNVRALQSIVRKIAQTFSGCVTWSQVCECFDPDVLSLEVGEEPIVHMRERDENEDALKEEIRIRLSGKGQELFDELGRRLKDLPAGFDLDPYNVYKLLHYLCASRSRKIRASDSRAILGIADAQFTKVARVLYESTMESYKKYYLITMLKEEKDGRALSYGLLADLYA